MHFISFIKIHFNMINRRNFLKNTSLLAAGSFLASNTAFASALSSAAKNFGLQTYSLGNELGQDVAGGLKRVGEMGYVTIELAGYGNGKINGVDMQEFKKMAEDAGLKITSTHVNPPVSTYTQENKAEIAEFWKKAVADHAAIGCNYIVQPGQPSTRNTEEVALVGEVFNEAGKIAKAAGLIFGYHNHSGEFARVAPAAATTPTEGEGGGRRRRQEGTKIIYDAMLEGTDPALVVFENDVYWTVMGQQDPVAYMKKYPDRIRLLHIKDKAVLGETGMMNFQKIFETAYDINISDFFVELEGYSGGQFNGVKGCADYLLNAPFVK